MSTSSPASSDDEHDQRKQQDTEGTSLNSLSSKFIYLFSLYLKLTFPSLQLTSTNKNRNICTGIN